MQRTRKGLARFMSKEYLGNRGCDQRPARAASRGADAGTAADRDRSWGGVKGGTWVREWSALFRVIITVAMENLPKKLAAGGLVFTLSMGTVAIHPVAHCLFESASPTLCEIRLADKKHLHTEINTYGSYTSSAERTITTTSTSATRLMPTVASPLKLT